MPTIAVVMVGIAIANRPVLPSSSLCFSLTADPYHLDQSSRRPPRTSINHGSGTRIDHSLPELGGE